MILSPREELIDKLQSKIPTILHIASNTDEIILAAYENFSEYQHINDEMSRIYRDENVFASEPRTLLFPLNESVPIKEHSYVPIVNQLLSRGKSIMESVLDIISNKLGDTGKQILIQHLESTDLMADEFTIKDIPKLVEIIQEVITPIFGKKSTTEISNKIKKLEKFK